MAQRPYGSPTFPTEGKVPNERPTTPKKAQIKADPLGPNLPRFPNGKGIRRETSSKLTVGAADCAPWPRRGAARAGSLPRLAAIPTTVGGRSSGGRSGAAAGAGLAVAARRRCACPDKGLAPLEWTTWVVPRCHPTHGAKARQKRAFSTGGATCERQARTSDGGVRELPRPPRSTTLFVAPALAVIRREAPRAWRRAP